MATIFTLALLNGSPCGNHPCSFQGKPEAVEVNDFANKTLVPPKKTKLVIHYKDSKGQPRIKGGPGLKLSQSYPLRFFGSTMPVFKFESDFKAIIFFGPKVFSVGRQTVWLGKENGYHTSVDIFIFYIVV